MPITTCIFDAYGTLFDVAAAAREAAAEPGRDALADVWPRLAEAWRLKQLQYTWLRAVADAHTDFWAVTQDGLDWAMEAVGLAGEAELRERMMTALMIAQSVRLRGRTILVAMSQISHIRRIIDQLDPLSKNRPSYEERLRRHPRLRSFSRRIDNEDPRD